MNKDKQLIAKLKELVDCLRQTYPDGIIFCEVTLGDKITKLESEITVIESDLAKEQEEFNKMTSASIIDTNTSFFGNSGAKVEEPEGVTADNLRDEPGEDEKEIRLVETYIRNTWGTDWLKNQWEAGDVIEAIRDFASSKQIDKRKFLKDFNSWMCGKQYDGRIPLIDTCITEYLNNK